jgi:Skp family chaperone for outer membrane proteins
MKTLLTLLLLLAPAVARAEAIGFVNVDRAAIGCSDGKALISELKADAAARTKAVQEAHAAKKPIAQSDKEWTEQRDRKAKDGSDRIGARVGRIVKKVAEAKHLTAVLPAPVYASSKAIDITDEVIRRYDAGEGRDEAEAKADETTKLREENARLKAQLAARAKITTTNLGKAP